MNMWTNLLLACVVALLACNRLGLGCLFDTEHSHDIYTENEYDMVLNPTNSCYNVYIHGENSYRQSVGKPGKPCEGSTCTIGGKLEISLFPAIILQVNAEFSVCCCHGILCNDVQAYPWMDPKQYYDDAQYHCYSRKNSTARQISTQCIDRSVSDPTWAVEMCYTSAWPNGTLVAKGCAGEKRGAVCAVMNDGECVQNPLGYSICCCNTTKCNDKEPAELPCWKSGKCGQALTTTPITQAPTSGVRSTTTERPFLLPIEIGVISAMALVLTFLIGVLLALIICIVRKRRRTSGGRSDPNKRTDVTTGTQLKGEATDGKGFIGLSYEGVFHPLHKPVVVKEMYPKGMDDTNFADKKWIQYREEMTQLDHLNLARIYQIYWPQKLNETPLIVYEKVGHQQSINAYLKARQSKSEAAPVELKYGVLAQVASAMAYLHSKGVSNPYIGGRNVVVDERPNAEDAEALLNIDHDARRGGLPLVKVTDYVMGSVLQERFKIQFLDTTYPELPIRWMPPETLEENIFSKETDVWAFGVLCWEVMNDGKRPFDTMCNVDAAWVVLGGESVEPEAMSNNEKMKELVYYRCFAFVETYHRPEMSELKTVLVGFYLGGDSIPPLVMRTDVAGANQTTESPADGKGVASVVLTAQAPTLAPTSVVSTISTARKHQNREELLDPSLRLKKREDQPKMRPAVSSIGQSMAIPVANQQ